MSERPAGVRRARPLLERQVLRTLRLHSMIEPGDHVLVAVSGGADSIALLHCLHRMAPRLEIRISAAHLNHCLRGAESDADEDFVREVCAGLGCGLTSEDAPIREDAASRRANLEETAREARYKFLGRIAARVGASRIAVGHTRNDQAETILFRFLRGSGAEGLAAIHPVKDGVVIRPLINTLRATVLDYLESLGVPHREDSSNRDLHYSRNRLRHELIPAIEKQFNPRLVETLAREAAIARETSDFLNLLARREYARIRLDSAHEADSASLTVAALLELHPLLRKLVIREALRRTRGTLKGINTRHIESAVRLCVEGRSGRQIELPGGQIVSRRFSELSFTCEKRRPGPRFCYDLAVPGRCVIPETGLVITTALSTRGEPPEPKRRVYLDPGALKAPLSVRSRLPGDRYGGPGHRKVKKMLIDAKISLHDRSRLPMIASGDDIIWIPGFEPAKAFRAQNQSAPCVVIELEEDSRAISREKKVPNGNLEG